MTDNTSTASNNDATSSHHPFPSNGTAEQGSTGPKRYIYTQADMEHFRHSSARKELLSFVTAMGRGLTTTDADTPHHSNSPHNYNPSQPLEHLTPALASLHGSLSCMAETWMDGDHPEGIPPDREAKARFGNPAFRTWHARLVKRSHGIVKSCLECHLNNCVGEADDQLKLLKECAKKGYQAASSDGHITNNSNKNEAETIEELRAYLHDSFGHPIRIDYGTGHESSFVVFLLALCKIGCFVSKTGTCVESGDSAKSTMPSPTMISRASLSLFHAYLNVTRGLQRDYMLEPAGSHGVWGLDDYHCIPFYVGACQLVAREQWQQQQLKEKKQNRQKPGNDKSKIEKQESEGDATPMNPYLPEKVLVDSQTALSTSISNDDIEHWEPSIIQNKQALEANRQTYLYFGCIYFILQIKPNVPFFESSPMLNDISSLGNWTKVSSGLLRLYEGEVLDKLPVVQHFVFGKIFSANWTPSRGPQEAPTRTFINGPMGDECIAPWASKAGGSNNAQSGNGGNSRYPGSMPPTRAPWAK